MELISLFKNLEQKENFEHGEPQTEENIQNLEKKLKVKFSKSYKKFLEKYGYISWFGGCIYGPSDNDYFDLLIRNKELREEEIPKDFQELPKDAFVVKEYGGGGYYMLFSSDSPRAGQVGLFLSENGYQEEQTWGSFEEFLEDYYG